MGEPGEAGGISRAFGMLFRPGRTWDAIADSLADPGPLMLRYAAPLAAIPAVCGVIGATAFGFSIASVGVRMSLAALVLGAVVGYGLMLVAVWLLALFIDLVAPAFGGRRGRVSALNLAVYGATPIWIGGLAELYPSASIPIGVLAAIYGLYLLFLGLPKLMEIPEDRRLTAFAAVLIAIGLLAVARGMVTAKAVELGGPLSASYAPR